MEDQVLEKLIYPLWKREDQSVDSLRDLLVNDLGEKLGQLDGVHGVRVAVADSAVEAAAHRRMASHPPLPDAVVSLWVDFAEAAPMWEPLFAGVVGSWAAYHVAEAEPLVAPRAHPSLPGERVYGMCQVVFLSALKSLSREEWLAIWKESHGQIAIDTQSTFGYRQNLVVRALSDNAVQCDAIVEEHFPPEAMTSDHAFYATGGDEALLQQHTTAMMESCARFIDFERIDVIPMSEYVLKSFTE